MKIKYATANGLLKKVIQLGLNIELTLLAKSYNIPDSSDESDGFDSSDLNYDNDKLDSQDIENINPSLIQNPIVHTRKGAPHKTRFKESHEVKQKNAEYQKTKG
ncbi:24091_t:CDS:2 [Racocetra persica]|uniref:24091_t:CDS:1 n=1 Tax=Racocetra persica TaxID=160502 RepID=A0ACA9MNF2_9GLOM|nr:24091_t:CDS:2 [Racocetra persica]